MVLMLMILGQNGIYFTWVAASYRGEDQAFQLIAAAFKIESLIVISIPKDV